MFFVNYIVYFTSQETFGTIAKSQEQQRKGLTKKGEKMTSTFHKERVPIQARDSPHGVLCSPFLMLLYETTSHELYCMLDMTYNGLLDGSDHHK